MPNFGCNMCSWLNLSLFWCLDLVMIDNIPCLFYSIGVLTLSNTWPPSVVLLDVPLVWTTLGRQVYQRECLKFRTMGLTQQVVHPPIILLLWNQRHKRKSCLPKLHRPLQIKPTFSSRSMGLCHKVVPKKLFVVVPLRVGGQHF